jgi:3-hydroxyacyl-[acyl-carrier-protein] dehydratase
MQLDSIQIQKILPHRYPFLFIDRVMDLEPKKSIHARKLVSNSDPILQGHFPGNPILPGVVQVEAMAQAAVILAYHSGVFDPEQHVCYFMGIQEAKFRSPALPGEVLDIHIDAERVGRIGKFSGRILGEDGKPKSSAKFTAIIDKKPETPTPEGP